MRIDKLLALFGLLFLFLTACGTPPEPPLPPPPNRETLEAATPDLSHLEEPLVIAARSGAISTGLKSVISEWEEQSGRSVLLLEFPYAYLRERIFTDVQTGGQHYDVVMIDDPWFPSLAGNGYLVPLSEFGYQVDDDFVNRSLDVSMWPPPFGPQPPTVARGQRSRLYALPLVGNVQLFVYRKDYLGDDLLTIDQMITRVSEVAEPENGRNGYAFRDDQGNPIVTEFNAWNWSYGGDIFDDNWNVIINQEKSVQALTDFLAFTGAVTPNADYNSGGAIVNAMLDGSALSAIVWPSDASSIGSDNSMVATRTVNITSFPAGERQTSQLGNWLLGVPITAKRKQAAFDFIVWATNRETMTEMARIGMPPTRESVYRDQDLVDDFWWFPSMHEALKNATWRPRTPEWNKIEHILGNYLVRAARDELTPQEALDGAAVEITELMRIAGYLE